MKYPVTLILLGAMMLLVGVGIRMHADAKYINKMYYHTVDSGLYEFADVFTEQKIGDALEVFSLIAGVAGGVWFVVVARKRK